MSNSRSRIPTLLHPASGLLLLGLDWLLFSAGVITLGVSTPLLATGGGVLAGLGIGWIQHRYTEDDRLKQVLKGIGGGLLVALPLPIAGTAVGGLILALSGLNQLSLLSSRSDETSTDSD